MGIHQQRERPVAGENDPSDGQLLFQLSRGDERSFRILFRRHERVAYRVALALVDSVWDAEEVASSAFFELWRKRDSVRLVGDSVLPWLIRTVSYVAKNQVRGRRRYQRLLRKLPASDAQPDHADEVARVVDAIYIAQDVQMVLGGLNARDASIVLLCIVQGLGPQEAATVLGIPEGTAKSQLHRVKGRLRVSLRDHSPNAEEAPA
ncbi:RNA polymerase sigma factor [Microbacterium rhizomatis]|uniref:RNA polymerase sigma factor n=1 Tax=Microbacterium rhizomatis TaxID=1631477 RepID=A0A5J5J0S5_9MICO|nr:RNA polymerase sigma factor [Microbacterium rhizomatis]